MEFESFLAVFGGLSLAYLGVKLIIQIIQGLRTFILPSIGFRNNLKKFGDWAVVTGCTDGIGKSYATQLAKQGINIVLMSRNLDKLQKVAEEIRSEYHVQTRIIVIDFSGDKEIYQDIGDKLKDLDIGILVNNVGMGVTCPDYYHTFPQTEICQMVNVNVLSVVMMTHIVLPNMIARNRGVIVNVASLCGAVPCPLNTTYSASKAFVDFFSRALDREYKEKGILVQCVMPGFVITNMTKGLKRSFLTPLPDEFVRQALETIGTEPRTCGYWSHSLKAWILSNLLPKFIVDALIWKLWFSLRENVYKINKRKEEKAKRDHKD